MSRNTSNASNGNDGMWFLEAVGAVPRPPTPSEVVAGLEAENTIPGDQFVAADVPADNTITYVALDGDPGTSTSSFAPIPRTTEEPPSAQRTNLHALADYSDLESPETGELPVVQTVDDTQLSPALRSRRDFRWPIVILLTVLIGAVIAAAVFLPRYAEGAALETRQLYYDSAAGIRAYLPDAQGALDAITNPTSTDQAIDAAVPAIAELDTRAFALQDAAARPLPSAPPIVPSPAIDALEPLQDTGAILGAASSDVASRLGTAYVYRTSIPLLLQPGDLPTQASTQEINDVSVRLAQSLATDAGIVADLPDDPAFVRTQAAAVAAIDRYADWQQEYLDALTGEDADTAADLVSELDRIRVDLTGVATTDTLGFRTELDLVIVDLAAQLETYMDDITRT